MNTKQVLAMLVFTAMFITAMTDKVHRFVPASNSCCPESSMSSLSRNSAWRPRLDHHSFSAPIFLRYRSNPSSQCGMISRFRAFSLPFSKTE